VRPEIAACIVGLMAPALMPALAHARDITIAVVGSITGDNAAAGEELQRGASAAVRDINAHGGVLGRELKLIVGDDGCDAAQAVAVAGQMVSDGVSAVIGHDCSGASIPASVVYNKAHLIEISPASTNPAFTDRGLDNVFRVCGRDDQQAEAAATYINKTFKNQKVAVIDDKSVYGKGLADGVKAGLRAAGMPVILDEQFESGADDYADLVAKLKQADPAVIYIGGYQVEVGLIVKETREAGLSSQFVSGNALTNEQFWQVAGPAGEGLVMTGERDPRIEPGAREIVAAFRGDHYEPDGYTLFSYAAVQIFAEAAEQAKSLNFADVNKALHADNFGTIMGEIAFDPKGDVRNPRYVLFHWHAGAYSAL
jgi:branched-chain amino acid transport system substrate-binding protein